MSYIVIQALKSDFIKKHKEIIEVLSNIGK